ncbi:hypothetical protein [uncultured Coprobacter sp.]|uniref:hypothetical protein n=2 Tax=Coprobacter TaxID=1348911 RepID=UPI002622EF01|nr:hypothetical protein [uncultured Coprobacter sp.]
MNWMQQLLIRWKRHRIKRRFGQLDGYLQEAQNKRLANVRKKIQRIERKIVEITEVDKDGFLKSLSRIEQESVRELLFERYKLLNALFAATLAEIEHFRQVNDQLFDLTKKMYSQSAAFYRQVLTTYTPSFDDDVEVEGRLRFVFNGPESVLQLENDAYYGSDFRSMVAVLSYFYDSDIEYCHNSLDLTKVSDMTDEELGFKDCLNDGTTWAEGCLCHPAMNHICICHAVHDLCTHKEYSIPDLLRMNDFWCEVGITHQHIVAQNVARMEWWKTYSYEEFAKKLRTEAEHRPAHLRFGQFIVIRTAELFPDAIGSSVWCGANDCFYDDTKVDAYLLDVYNQLHI